MKNALTVDVEDWYHTKDFDFDYKDWGKYESRIEYSLNTILELFLKHNVKATFFVLGYVARNHPELIRKIQSQGHEIGSHGNYHKLVYKQTPKEFREDICNSKKLLEDILGKEVNFFRASSWSISSENLWALNILEEEGFKVDSSVQPFKTPLSGMKKSPITPFHPIVNGKKLNLLEFPPTVLSLGGLKIPFAGGFYLRILPFQIIKYALKNVNKKREGLIYTHPWETDINQPKLKTSPIIKFVHYTNISTTTGKLEKLLSSFEFFTLGETIKDKKYDFYELK